MFYEDDEYEEELCLKYGDDGGDLSVGFSGKKKVIVEREVYYLFVNSEMFVVCCYLFEFNKF